MMMLLWGAVGCEALPPDPPELAWSKLRNPVLSRSDGVKDAFAVHEAGRCHLGYSLLTEDPSFRIRLGFSSTPDLLAPLSEDSIDQPELGGLASPDVVRAPDGRFVMTHNSHTHDVGTVESKLYHRTSTDLVTWSAPSRFHVEGADHDEDRLIDAALAYTDTGAFLFFKLDQAMQVAYAAGHSLDGPWTLVGALDPASVENPQLLLIDGVWHLLATTIPVIHHPRLYRLTGDPGDPQAWLHFELVRELAIPQQRWNGGSDELSAERDTARTSSIATPTTATTCCTQAATS